MHDPTLNLGAKSFTLPLGNTKKRNPLSPPLQRRLQSPPPKSKFLAVRRRATDELVHEQLDRNISFVIYHEYVQRLRQHFRSNQAAL